MFVLGLHRQFKGEMEIKRFLTILHRRREGKKREREEEQRQGGREELIEEEREVGNWGCHYKHLHFAKRR